jgi:hypothetical protein
MERLIATFFIPPGISQGLTDGIYERVGGVIREVGSKQVVTWLRDSAPIGLPSMPLPVDPISGALHFAAQMANTAVTAKGFSNVNMHLDLLAKSMLQVQGVLYVTSAASILNLGVTAIGFAVVIHRLNQLERQLEETQKLLAQIDRKIDLSFYAKFRAALDLADNAFRMNKPTNREKAAHGAIKLLLEAQHIYTDYLDKELKQQSPIADEYLLTLYLAYIAESRCYLELEEKEVALKRLEEGHQKIHSRMRTYIESLLTSNPGAYLHPRFRKTISLSRLTRIYQWLDPTMNENRVFEKLQDNLYCLEKELNSSGSYKWSKSLPAAIVASKEVRGSIWGNDAEMTEAALKRLPSAMGMMETMIETHDRFQCYQTEIKAMLSSGMTFSTWTKLSPARETQPKDSNLMYIVPAKYLK